MDPSPKQCSTSKNLNVDASPKAISERTSYLQVRLEFLRYPQVIQALFNVPWFGPPVRLTAPSTCSWVGHMVSGLRHDTKGALFRLGFPTAPSLQLNLASYRNSPVHSTKARSHPLTGSELVVGTRFQVLFHSPPGCFSPFPHGTGSLSVTREYLGLGDGPPRFRRDFSCPAVTQDTARYKDYFKYEAITLFGWPSQVILL